MVKLGVLIAMENCLEQVAGKSVAARVMEGSEQITEKTDKKTVALWVKNAMERLDASLDEKTKVRIMQDCGYNCAKKNHKVIERAIGRRKKYMSTDDFLMAEQQNPMKGTRLVREGNMLYQSYTPQTFTRPMRCYCGYSRGFQPKTSFHSRTATAQKDSLRNTGKQSLKNQSRLTYCNQQFLELKNANSPFTFDEQKPLFG